MTRSVLQRPRARLDLLEQYVYLGEQANVDVAERYFEAVHKAFALLSQQPHAGSVYNSGTRRMTELRRLPVKDFEKYLIFYRVRPTRIEVARVLHGSRDIDSILAEEE